MRDRSIVCPCTRAICSTHSSTADSIPSPSRSILRKPASSQESLSHWHIWRPSIAAGWTGTSSINGRLEITIPPGCCEMWRGSPAISAQSSPNARQRGEASFVSASGRAASSSWTRFGLPSVRRARRSSSRERQAERLAEVADRAARAVRGEAGDQRGVLTAVLLGHSPRSASRGCRAGSRGRCRGPTRARGSGSARARAPPRPDRHARAR